nr:uncharacterized protein CFP56_73704 [Quercus suber]
MNNRPWSFDGNILVLRRWEIGITVSSVTFPVLPIWIQIWGLPFDLLSEEVGREIGSGMGRVVEVDTKTFTAGQARFIRVRVEIPLDKPIRCGGSVLNPEGNKTRIGFKYKRLVGLCFQCGRFGHERRSCTASSTVHEAETPYGEWLRAGTKIREDHSAAEDHTIKATKPGFMRNVGPKSSTEYQLSNPTETFVSIPVKYLRQEHIPHVPNEQVGQSHEVAHDSIKNTQNKTNERVVKWTRVDFMPNIHNTDTPRVTINIGTKRGRMECMEDTEGNKQLTYEDKRQWDRGKVLATFAQKTCEEILGMPLNNVNSRDVLVWKENRAKKFTMRTAYRIAVRLKNPSYAEHSLAQSHGPTWRKIWRLNVPPKLATCSGSVPLRGMCGVCPTEEPKSAEMKP